MITKFSFIFTFFFVLFACQIACGQNENAKINNQSKVSEKADLRIENLEKQANELYAAFDKNDFDKFAELTHPKVIEKVGGRENMISMMKTVAEQNPKIFETFSTSVGTPSELVEAENLLFGVVPQKSEGMTYGKRKVTQDACVVGVSNDSGKTWKFVSGEKFNELFPSVKGKIQIIPQKTFVDGIEQ